MADRTPPDCAAQLDQALELIANLRADMRWRRGWARQVLRQHKIDPSRSLWPDPIQGLIETNETLAKALLGHGDTHDARRLALEVLARKPLVAEVATHGKSDARPE